MYSIRVVSEESGIKAPTLRKWEERYGFPSPVRNPNGARIYTENDLQKLKAVKSLLDQGQRPSKIFTSNLFDSLNPVHVTLDSSEEALKVYTLGKSGLLGESLVLLKSYKHSMSTLKFVETVCAPLAILVGEGWANNDIPVYVEHMLSEQLHSVLTIDQSCFFDSDAPLAVLTTLSNEHHTLGLKMANAVLNDAGCRTVYLGSGLPISEIISAATNYHSEFVGLSITSNSSPRIIGEQINMLRSELPDNIQLLLGGAGCAHLSIIPKGVIVISSLSSVYPLIQQ